VIVNTLGDTGKCLTVSGGVGGASALLCMGVGYATEVADSSSLLHDFICSWPKLSTITAGGHQAENFVGTLLADEVGTVFHLEIFI
jgi:hypothetical protein